MHDRHKRALADRGAGTCPDCGKVRYMTRKGARRSGPRMGATVHTYRCGQFWHSTTETAEQTAARRDFEALEPTVRRAAAAAAWFQYLVTGVHLQPWEWQEWDAMTQAEKRAAISQERTRRAARKEATA